MLFSVSLRLCGRFIFSIIRILVESDLDAIALPFVLQYLTGFDKCVTVMVNRITRWSDYPLPIERLTNRDMSKERPLQLFGPGAGARPVLMQIDDRFIEA